ncbi:MAG: hypothetical protein ACI87E_001723 [Mariniblastus sp.]|jgi:hypothetical protein
MPALFSARNYNPSSPMIDRIFFVEGVWSGRSLLGVHFRQPFLNCIRLAKSKIVKYDQHETPFHDLWMIK